MPFLWDNDSTDCAKMQLQLVVQDEGNLFWVYFARMACRDLGDVPGKLLAAIRQGPQDGQGIGG